MVAIESVEYLALNSVTEFIRIRMTRLIILQDYHCLDLLYLVIVVFLVLTSVSYAISYFY